MRSILKKDNIKRYEGWWAFHNGKLKMAVHKVKANTLDSKHIVINDAFYIEKDAKTEDTMVTLGWETLEREPITIKFWKDRRELLRHEYQKVMVARNDALVKLVDCQTALAILQQDTDTIAHLLMAPT
jgi:hypothetical protein